MFLNETNTSVNLTSPNIKSNDLLTFKLSRHSAILAYFFSIVYELSIDIVVLTSHRFISSVAGGFALALHIFRISNRMR